MKTPVLVKAGQNLCATCHVWSGVNNGTAKKQVVKVKAGCKSCRTCDFFK